MAGIVVDPRMLAWILGAYTGVLAGILLIVAVGGWLFEGHVLPAFEWSLGIGVALAGTLLRLGRQRESRPLRDREAILLVVLVWLMLCLVGALPFYFSAHFNGLTDAFFESASGFTTTGATVLEDLESLPATLHLWRALSHWLGGMGIVVLGLAILPLLSQGGQGLYRAEFSGAGAKRLKPRIAEVVRALWRIYLALTALLFVLLWLAGMSAFDALCHAFSTLGTGGFSTRTASIAAFDAPVIEYILIVFMLLAGISFIQHYRLWVFGKAGDVMRDYEIRAYLLLVVTATTVIGVQLGWDDAYDWEQALRTALFQVVSIVTTTGFISSDYEQWAPLGQMLLFTLMFVGGCTGSTAGGLKVARAVLLWRVIAREFHRISEPNAILRIRVSGEVIDEETVNALLNLVYLAWLVLLVASLLVTASGVDILTAVSAVVACQFNIGPGLGNVGPTENFAHLGDFAKWVLALCMIAGRLEFYAMLVVLSRRFWKL